MKKIGENGNFLGWEAVKKDWPLWVLMGMLLAAAVIIYPQLPEQMPRHWNFKGEIDAYWGRTAGVFAPLAATFVIYMLLVFLPYLDPKKENYARFAGAYTFVRWLLVVFLSLIYIISILAAMGYDLPISLLVKAMVAVLLMLIGNFMGQFRHNYFVGIRTPWTLADEVVWQKTHRLGAKVWVMGGFICLLAAFMDNAWGLGLFIVSIIVMVIWPVVYSYLVFRKLRD